MKNCPLCYSRNNRSFKKYGIIGSRKYGCEMVFCSNCLHFFTKIPRAIEYKKLYNEGQYQILDTRKSLFEKIVAFDDELIIRQLKKLSPPIKSLLDFGCGKGQFMWRAMKRGWRVKGIETGRKRAEYGKNVYRLDIITNVYKGGLVKGGPFDLITLFHVLEHLDNPRKLLKKLFNQNLKQGGYVVIEVPSFDSLQAKMGGKEWIHLDPPFHVSHFTKNRLLKLIDELGLDLIKLESFSIHLGVFGMLQVLMSWLGYRKMIITELKFHRTKKLLLFIFALLPFAVVLEILSAIFKKGGVIRIYCKANKAKSNFGFLS